MPSISENDVRTGLEQILSSTTFANSPQLQAFLKYIVTTTLAGRQKEIKGYTIAVEGLGRPENFDPQLDPIVRVEGARLRRLLQQYYDGEGVKNPVLIQIPKGTYVPTFEESLQNKSPDSIADDLDSLGEQTSAADKEAELSFTSVDLSALKKKSLGKQRSQSGAEKDTYEQQPTYTGGFSESSSNPVFTPNTSAHQAYISDGNHRKFAKYAVFASLLIVALIGSLYFFSSDQFKRNLWDTGPNFADADRDERLRAISLAQDIYPKIYVEPVDLITPSGIYRSASATEFTSQLISALTRFPQVSVVVDKEQADYVLSGTKIQTVDEMKADFILVNNHTKSAIWSGAHTTSNLDVGESSKQTVLVRKISSALAQAYGIIMANRIQYGGSEIIDIYSCLLKTYAYFDRYDEGTHKQSKECIISFIKENDAFAEGYANLAYLYLDEHRLGYNEESGDPLDRALNAAKRAVGLMPQNPYANQALMDVQFVRGDNELALKTARQVHILNPFDPESLAAIGATYIQIGNLDEGLKLMEEAYFYNPARPIWYDFYLFNGYLLKRNYSLARAHAFNMASDDYALGILARMIAASFSRGNEAIKEELAKLLSLQPEFNSAFQNQVVKLLGENRATDAILDELKRMNLGQYGVAVDFPEASAPEHTDIATPIQLDNG